MANIDVEFSRTVEVEKIGVTPWTDKFEATEKECSALSLRFGIESLKNLKAEVTLRRMPGNKIIMAQGCFGADVVQKCVVTLEPVKSRITSEFTSMFTEDNVHFLPGAEITVSPEEGESPEPIENGIIDMGEMVAQQLALEIDLYPRSPRAKEMEDFETNDENGKKSSPFSVLAKLRKKKDS